MNWREGLVLYANNKMVLNGESVVEAFMNYRIFSSSVMERWDETIKNETALTPILIKRIIEIFENLYPDCPPLKIETLFVPYSGPATEETFQANTDDDWDKVMDSMMFHQHSTEDSLIIMGLSKDMDGMPPTSIWSWNNDNSPIDGIRESPLYYWGVPSSSMVEWSEKKDYFTTNWMDFDEVMMLAESEAQGETLFNNRMQGSNLRWEDEEDSESFYDYKRRTELKELTKTHLLTFAFKITPQSARVLNWSEFPVSLI